MTIATYDTQVVFSILEALAWIVIVSIAVYTLTRAKIFPQAYKTLLFVIVAIWGVTYLGSRAIDTYHYYDQQRPAAVEAIKNQATY